MSSLRLSLRCTIPIHILAMAMRIESQYFLSHVSPLVDSFEELHTEILALLDKYHNLCDQIGTAQTEVETLLSDTQPVWTDTYNLCGDATCDGMCTVCWDGEYLGEEHHVEKYCRRGRR
jgi:hypothetical protein